MNDTLLPLATTVASPLRRRLRFVLGTLLVLVAGVGVGEWLGWPFLAGPLQTVLSDKLDRRVRLTSDDNSAQPNRVRIRLLGGVLLQTSQLEVAAPAWSKAPHLLLAQDVSLQMRYVDLWRAYEGQRLRVDRLQATALDAHLERRADGLGSWQFGKTPMAGLEGSTQPMPVPLFGDLQLTSGLLHYNDVLMPLDLEARLSLEAAAASNPVLRVDGSGHYRKLPFKIELTSSGALPWQASGDHPIPDGLVDTTEAVPVALTLNATVGRASLAFKGSATDALRLNGLTGRFSVKGPSLAAMGDPVGVTLPTTAAFRTDGRLVRQGKTWRVVIDDATVGASRLSGAFTYEAGLSVPTLSGRLSGSRLLLVDLGPVVGTTNGKATVKTTGALVLPSRPFDLAALRAMNANVLIDIAEVDLNTRWLEPLRPLHTHLQLKDGVLMLDNLDARTAQGALKGNVRLDGRGTKALWRAALRWDSVKIERWLRQARAANLPPFVSGQLNGRATLEGQGRSTAEILATLKGQVHTELRDGAVSHLLIEAGGLDLAQGLGVMLKGDDALPLQCAVADLAIDGGVLRPRVMVLDTTDSTVWLEGSVSLATEALDLRAVVAPKDFSPLALRTPLEVRGSLGQPVVSLEKGPLGVKLATSVLLAFLNPLAALIPLMDPGDAMAAQRSATGCQNLMQRSLNQSGVKRTKRQTP